MKGYMSRRTVQVVTMATPKQSALIASKEDMQAKTALGQR